eukprot:scpid16971/ scgid22840/ Retrovirus-related Pol polyprotein from transposon 412; Protease; Reverse transcriptase; Endonuclease
MAGLKVKPKKCQLLCSSVTYLGYTFSADGVLPDTNKYAVVKDWSVPSSAREVRSFLGFASYYRRFVPNFSTVAGPLHHLSHKDTPFIWTDDCKQAFAQLKSHLISPPVLAYPDAQKALIYS